MQALYHSPFLQALGYAIANSFWQIALLWLLVIVLNGIIKPSAAGRYRIAVAGQLTGFAWFIVTFRFYLNKCLQAVQDFEALQIPDRTSFYISYPDATAPGGYLHWLLKIEQLLPFLSVAYLLLLVFLVVKWAVSYRKAQEIRHNGLEKIGAEWRVFVQKVAQQLHIKAPVKIYLSSFIKSPLTVGFFKPLILIPLASINHLTTEQLEAVILHELAHIKRADYLINLLQTIIEIVLFFNPFTRLLSTIIRKERENCCDDWVLQFQYNPAMYAEALLSIAWLQQQPAFAMPAAGDKGELLPRVKRMLSKQEAAFDYKKHAAALMLMTVLLSAFTWFSPAATTPPQPVVVADRSKLQPVVVEPVTAAVNNPLFSPVFFLAKSKKAPVKVADNVKVQTEITDKEAAAPVITEDTVNKANTAIISTVAIHELQLQPNQPEPQVLLAEPAVNVQVIAATTPRQPRITRTARGKETPKNRRYIQFTQVFTAFETPRLWVRPPQLPEAGADSLFNLRRVKGRLLLSPPPPPDALRRLPPTAAMVLERLLHHGNDSLNRIVISTIAQAKTNADSVNILRQFYRELWQQAKQHHMQTETALAMQAKTHWAFSRSVFVESDSTVAQSASKEIIASGGDKHFTIILTHYSATTACNKEATDTLSGHNQVLIFQNRD